MNRLPILTFHAIHDSKSPVAFGAEPFESLMRRLASLGWQTVSGADVVAFARGGRELPPKSFAVTFDDGYASVLTRAAPVLRELGFGAILFLTPALLGRAEILPDDPLSVREPSLTWVEAQQLAAGGFEIGSHAATHRDLRRLSDGDLALEMSGSRKTLEDRLGVAVRLHAYPFGACDARVVSAAEHVYEGAFTTVLDFVRPGASPRLLPRLDAHYLRFLATRGSLDSGGTARYLAFRRAGRAVRAMFHRGDAAS